jgi:hypothetical protein
MFRYEKPEKSILSCEEAVHLACGTFVVLLGCRFMPEIMHRRAPDVFLHQ